MPGHSGYSEIELVSLGLEPSGAFTVRKAAWGTESSTMPSGDQSRELRRMAAECLAAARQTSDSGVRASLVEMAQRWLDLAERSEHSGWNEALRLRALVAAMGQELRTIYGLPQNIPHRLLALLLQLDAQCETD